MTSEAKAAKVKDRYSDDFLSRPGVWGVGVEREAGGAVLVVHVDAAHPDTSAAFPSEIDGVPIKVIEAGPYVKQPLKEADS